MVEGIQSCGDKASLVYSYQYPGTPSGDVAVFYGLKDGMKQVLHDYVDAGRKVVFLDLGYWGRREGGRYQGYHRFAINQRHAIEQVMGNPQPSDRFDRFGLTLEPMRKYGDYILLAGMSRKAAKSWRYHPEEWERDAIRQIKKVTDRPIIYRPKPSWKMAKPIEGTHFSEPKSRLEPVLRGAWAVVTHHSNVAVDGLIQGIPCFLNDGIAKPLGLSDLGRIEDPYYPDFDLVKQWAYNVAYCQWSVPEMRMGIPWRHLKKEGLLT